MSEAVDRDGRALRRGDLVEVVYGGEAHLLEVEEVAPGANPDSFLVVGAVRLAAPARTCRWLGRVDGADVPAGEPARQGRKQSARKGV